MSADLESSQLRKGTVFRDGGRVFIVLNYKHVKKGRGLATIRVKVRDVESGSIVEKTFSSNEKVDSVSLGRKSAQYLYSDDNYSYFMDNSDFSQFQIGNGMIEWQRNFLTEGAKIQAVFLEEKVISIDIPKKVSLKVKYTEPGVVGDTATGAEKEAELETGYKVNVPLFVKIGDSIKVNTERGNYVSKG